MSSPSSLPFPQCFAQGACIMSCPIQPPPCNSSSSSRSSSGSSSSLVHLGVIFALPEESQPPQCCAIHPPNSFIGVVELQQYTQTSLAHTKKTYLNLEPDVCLVVPRRSDIYFCMFENLRLSVTRLVVCIFTQLLECGLSCLSRLRAHAEWA